MKKKKKIASAVPEQETHEDGRAHEVRVHLSEFLNREKSSTNNF
jgi:hypothetical protein